MENRFSLQKTEAMRHYYLNIPGIFIISKYDTKGIWKFSIADSAETAVIDDLHLFDWANFDIDRKEGIYYVSRQSTGAPTFLKYRDANNETKTIMNTGLSRKTRITLSYNNSELFGTQTVDRNVDVILYRSPITLAVFLKGFLSQIND